MAVESQVRAVENNLRAAMRCYGYCTDAGEVRELPGVVLANSGVDFPVFNSAMLTEPVEDGPVGLDRRVQLAKIHFNARGIGWSFWLCNGLLDETARTYAGRIFSSHGMSLIAEPPGMFAGALAPPDRPQPELRCIELTNDHSRETFVDLASVIFALPFRVSRAVYGRPEPWDAGMRGYLGYFQGKAVSIVTTVSAAGVTGVYSLGTLPQHQGRGFGEAILRFALAQGKGPSILQTTRSGMKLYTRLGFRTVTSFSVYVTEGCGPAK